MSEDITVELDPSAEDYQMEDEGSLEASRLFFCWWIKYFSLLNFWILNRFSFLLSCLLFFFLLFFLLFFFSLCSLFDFFIPFFFLNGLDATLRLKSAATKRRGRGFEGSYLPHYPIFLLFLFSYFTLNFELIFFLLFSRFLFQPTSVKWKWTNLRCLPVEPTSWLRSVCAIILQWENENPRSFIFFPFFFLLAAVCSCWRMDHLCHGTPWGGHWGPHPWQIRGFWRDQELAPEFGSPDWFRQGLPFRPSPPSLQPLSLLFLLRPLLSFLSSHGQKSRLFAHNLLLLLQGYSLIEYNKYDHAQEAINAMNNTDLLGKRIQCDWAFVKPTASKSFGRSGGGGSGGGRRRGRSPSPDRRWSSRQKSNKKWNKRIEKKKKKKRKKDARNAEEVGRRRGGGEKKASCLEKRCWKQRKTSIATLWRRHFLVSTLCSLSPPSPPPSLSCSANGSIVERVLCVPWVSVWPSEDLALTAFCLSCLSWPVDLSQ